jgi:hypothetical protein
MNNIHVPDYSEEYKYRDALSIIAGICDAALRPYISDERVTKQMHETKLRMIESEVFKAMPHLKPEESK